MNKEDDKNDASKSTTTNTTEREMIVKNEHNLEAGKLLELFHQNTFCCRADALLEIIQRSC
jgi:hypothetical protein